MHGIFIRGGTSGPWIQSQEILVQFFALMQMYYKRSGTSQDLIIVLY